MRWLCRLSSNWNVSTEYIQNHIYNSLGDLCLLKDALWVVQRRRYVPTYTTGPYTSQFIRVCLNVFAVYKKSHQHVAQFRAIFERLGKHHASLSLEKCRFGFEKGLLLSQVVSLAGIQPDLAKVEKIREIEESRN